MDLRKDIGMKKISLLLVIVMALCLLCACGSKAADPGMEAVGQAVVASFDTEGLVDTPDDYVQAMMYLNPEDYESRCALISGIGTNINELGIFKGTDEEQTAAIKEAIDNYLQLRREIWMEEYLPEEFPKLENATVWVEGNYVMYAILDSDSAAAAHDAFVNCFVK